MNSVHRSVLFSGLDRYAGLVLFLVSTAVLSRLLTPSEFGVFAVVDALTTVIAAPFQEFGEANYLIQKHELSRGTIRRAFTVTWLISLAVAPILLASVDVVSQIVGQDSLRRGIQVSALNLLLLPVSGTLIALFRRDMQFGTLAICNLASNMTVVALVSIGLAALNFSYMAPIWGGVAGSIVLTAMLLNSHSDFGVLRPSLSEYRDVLRFGFYSSGVSVINIFYNLAPQLFLAKVLDFTAVGLYSRAINLTQVFDRLVTQVLTPIVLPAIVSRRAAGADPKGVYLDAIQLLSAVQWPFLTFVALMAKPIVVLHLVATVAPWPPGRILSWRGSSRSVRVADATVPTGSGDILSQSASCAAAGRARSCRSEERYRHNGDRLGRSRLCGVDRGRNTQFRCRP